MKDIFEMLNDVPVEEAEFTELPAGDLERRRVKDAVRLRIEEEKRMEQSSKEKRSKKRMASAIACSAAVIVGISGLGMIFPAYAKEIPVVGDIFRYLDNGRTGQYERYKESASDIDMTKEAKGISVTLNDGIYDGTTLTLTYTVKTDADMGDSPHLDADIRFDRSLGINGWGGSSSVKKVEEGIYVGMDTFTLNSEKEGFENIPFTWKIRGVSYADEDGNPQGVKDVTCNLNFNVELSAVSGESTSLSASAVEPEKGMELTLAEMSRTKVNTVLKYRTKTSMDIEHNFHIDWEIRDDLGNVYEDNDLGATGCEENGMWTEERRMDIRVVAPEAKKLILTPTISYALPSENGEIMGGGISIDSKTGEETPLKDVPREWTEPFATTPGSLEIEL